MSKKYEIFLFDLDGTITDSALGITNQSCNVIEKVRTSKRQTGQNYNKFIGPPL